MLLNIHVCVPAIICSREVRSGGTTGFRPSILGGNLKALWISYAWHWSERLGSITGGIVTAGSWGWKAFPWWLVSPGGAGISPPCLTPAPNTLHCVIKSLWWFLLDSFIFISTFKVMTFQFYHYFYFYWLSFFYSVGRIFPHPARMELHSYPKRYSKCMVLCLFLPAFNIK